jgi:hypothetical protein
MKPVIDLLLFFLLPFPFLAIRLFTVPFGRPLFPLQFPFCLSQVMRRGSRALSPATHAHSTSHSQTYTTTLITYSSFIYIVQSSLLKPYLSGTYILCSNSGSPNF